MFEYIHPFYIFSIKENRIHACIEAYGATKGRVTTNTSTFAYKISPFLTAIKSITPLLGMRLYMNIYSIGLLIVLSGSLYLHIKLLLFI